jgi:broad specificity phosphatase PhoE
MESTRVWLLRHAETATPHVFHGAESDIGLSELGKAQAATAAGWFRELSPTVVVSSGMKRAVETAGPIARACGVPHEIEPTLHERRVGILSGTSFGADEGPWHDTLRAWMAGDTNYTTPGAESFEELRARLLQLRRGMSRRHARHEDHCATDRHRVPALARLRPRRRTRDRPPR